MHGLKENMDELSQTVYTTGEVIEVARQGEVIALLMRPHQPQHLARDANVPGQS